MNCTGTCKGIMPKVTPELIKASKMVREYYRDFCNELGCESDPQCFIRWFNDILLSKEFYKEMQENK